MSRTLRSRITYANVMSTLAVFIALGGGAWAVSGRPAASSASRVATATGQSPQNDVLRACVDNRTGAARIVAAGHPCTGREHRVSWVSFNGHFASDHKTSSIDVTDSGIVLNSTAAGETPQTIKLSPGGVTIESAGIHLTSGHNLSLTADHDLSLTTGNDMTTTVHGDQTSTVDKDSTSTIHKNETDTIDGNLTSTVHKGETSTVDKDQTSTVDGNQVVTVGKNRVSTVGISSADTVGAALQETVGASMSTSIGGSQNTTINGNSNTSAIGGTLDTTAGTIKNNADLIQNVSDGSLLNSAGTSLTNHADGALLNSAGGNLTNQSAKTLLNKATLDLTNQAGGDLLEKAAATLTVKATGEAILSAPITHLGCGSGAAAARHGDQVQTTGNPGTGTVTGGSTSVFVC